MCGHSRDQAADLARRIAEELTDVRHNSETDSEWFPFVISGFSNPDQSITDYEGMIRSALRVASGVDLRHCKWGLRKPHFFTYQVDANNDDDEHEPVRRVGGWGCECVCV